MSPALLARLLVARELIVVDLADRALESLLLALEVEHPTLAAFDEPTRAPSLRRARRVARCVVELRRELADYRAAVDAAIMPRESLDDDPSF
jgi:hypothetical protein